MLKTFRRGVAVLTLVVTTVITGLTVMASPASAAKWDPTIPSDWSRRALFAGGIPTNLRLDVRYGGGHGTPVHLWASSNEPTQVWAQEAADQGGFYLHPAFNRWLCLDFDGDRAAGATLKVNNCNGSASQRWYEGFQYDHAFGLVTHSDNRYCVDVPSSNFSSGQTLQIWDCNQTNAQRIYGAGCYEDSCLGRSPEIMGCGFGALVGADFTVNSSRVTMLFSNTCNSVWGRMTVDPGIQTGRKVVLQRFLKNVNGVYDQFSSAYLNGGATGWTSMYGRGLGWRFQVCFDATHNGGPFECSGQMR
ncbi:RICIN domain-containing protein [Micromonospora sp. NBC_01638]|uniref:RICIN domain-containing protein n=1 Tax=Micromonospora sp. NBC_01638 TaxID=2975982 RepID=UPI00386E4C05|nr:ricin-type beta-trefoil lectin domain protein [Micromonospora sp. NBC_01638]